MKSTTIAIVATVLFIGGALFLVSNKNSNSNTTQVEDIQNVSIVDGKQIIEIKAKGGYTPRVSTAKANIPTVIRFDTNGTFDCSASVRIPSMNVSKILPNSGSTDIEIQNPEVGTLQGTCGMGMYPFTVEFKM